MRSLSIASSGMLAQQTNVDVISHNIANMNTTGFKRQRAEFQDLLYQQEIPPGAGATVPARHRASRSVRASRPARSIASSNRAHCSKPATAMTWRSRGAAISR